MNWLTWASLKIALHKLHIYRQYEIDPGTTCTDTPRAWINRLTEHDRFGQIKEEVWLIRLPNWGFEYWLVEDEYVWAQKWVAWSTVTGKIYNGIIPVNDG